MTIEAELLNRQARVLVNELRPPAPVAQQDLAVAGLAASMIASFEQVNINPDPDVWQLISDKQLSSLLGPTTFGVLERRRDSMVKWMRILLDAT